LSLFGGDPEELKLRQMNTTINKVNRPTSRKDWNRSATRFTVYTDGVARSLADHVYLTKHAL